MNIQGWFLDIGKRLPKHPNPRTRLILLLVGLVFVAGLSWYITGSVVPADNQQANIFQGGILLVIFGSLFLEDKFTKPADAVVNAVTAIVALVPVYRFFGWTGWLVMAYCGFVALTGAINLAFGEHQRNETWGEVKRITYYLSTILGKSNVIFSIVFLYAVFSFYGVNVQETALLVFFWGTYIALWPLKIPHIVQALFSKENISLEKGVVLRVDSPDLIRVKLHRETSWQGIMFVCLGDGTKRGVLPLYTQVQDNQVIGTGLLSEVMKIEYPRTRTGGVYEVKAISEEGEDEACVDIPVGFVVERSKIAKIYFETWRSDDLSEGLLAFCEVKGERVYYQVTDAATTEEVFERHKHGFQVVEAHQLGTLNPEGGFKKFNWVPEMNTPVYLAGCEVQEKPLELPPPQMCLGVVPGSNVEVVGDIDEMISHHTAILGVTGSGKTELAYTIIQKAIENDVKVFCVDITGHYSQRLIDLGPKELSIRREKANHLSSLLFAVDARGWKEEKEALEGFREKFVAHVDEVVENFMTGTENLGIFTMPDISNTRATLYATEVYLSSIFEYGRKHFEGGPRILVVLEEAHTVIPEATTMGLADFDSKAIIAKIAQIALQGRKYNVGLLVITQRTATVSKTVLTQCNTMITFASFDQTGLDFLSNVYGAEHTARVSNLPFLHALVFGKGIKSERPVVVQIPEKPELKKSKHKPKTK